MSIGFIYSAQFQPTGETDDVFEFLHDSGEASVPDYPFDEERGQFGALAQAAREELLKRHPEPTEVLCYTVLLAGKINFNCDYWGEHDSSVEVFWAYVDSCEIEDEEEFTPVQMVGE